MTEKRCTQCGSVWTMPVSLCAFCGGKGEDRPAPPAVDVTPVSYPANGQPPPAAAAKEAPKRATARIRLSAEELPPFGEERSTARRVPPPPEAVRSQRLGRPPAPPARPPLAPPAAPFVFALLAILACGVLPFAVQNGGDRSLAAVGLVASAAFALLAPVAWYAAQRHEQRCREHGLQPAPAAQVGKVLGIIGTLLVVFEIAAFTVLVVTLGVTPHNWHSP